MNRTHSLTIKMAAALFVVIALPLPVLPQRGPGPNGAGCCLPATTEALTAEETKWLVFMREEEKLARDIYQQMSAKWGLRIVANIKTAEQRHFDVIGGLLTRYVVTDPPQSAQPGVFADAGLSTLYNNLMAKGKMSVKDALEAGLAIEKVDIADLERALAATNKPDLKTVYGNLLAASRNHQQAFETMLQVAATNP